MAHALWIMTTNNNKHQHRKISSRDYEISRKIYVDNHPNKSISYEERKFRSDKQSKSRKGKQAHPNTIKALQNYRDKIECGIVDNPMCAFWKVHTPDGQTILLKNLSKFCRENNLSNGNLSKFGKSKGYRVEKLGRTSEVSY